MEAVSFDLDGTLVRSSEPRKQSLEHVRKMVDPDLPELTAETYQTAFQNALAERLPNTAWELPVRRAAFKRAFDAAGSVPPPPSLEAFTLAYRYRRLKRLRPQDEAPETLSKICRNGGTVAVVTNGPAGLQQEKLLRTGLMEHVDVVVVAGRCGAMKPDPKPLNDALKRIDVSNNKIIHVGDSRCDVDGALRAGVRPVVFEPNGDGERSVEHVLRCTSLVEVYRQFFD
jgi:putative hydrolase of the HAD superfamily